MDNFDHLISVRSLDDTQLARPDNGMGCLEKNGFSACWRCSSQSWRFSGHQSHEGVFSGGRHNYATMIFSIRRSHNTTVVCVWGGVFVGVMKIWKGKRK